MQRQRRSPIRAGDDGERGEQAVDVDHAVRHAAHPRVARQVVELVNVERSRHETRERALALPPDEGQERLRLRPEPCERFRQRSSLQVACREILVVEQAGLFEGMRERVVPDVVEQGRQLEAAQLGRRRGRAPRRLLELRQRPARQMVGAERVLEPRVRGAGVDEERVSQLAHVPQPLHRGRVHHGECLGVEPDVVPQRVADDLELAHRATGIGRGGGGGGPASRTAGGTRAANGSKFRRNASATRAAAAS